MKNILLYSFKIVNRLFSGTMSKARYFAAWQYMYRVSLQGIGRIQGWPIEKSGELDALKNLFRSGQNSFSILDVGSNTGQYAEAIISQFPQSASLELHLFEPSAKNHLLLQEKFRNQAGDRLQFYHNREALSDVNAEAVLFADASGSDLSSLLDLKLPIRPFDPASSEKVITITLDRYVAENKIRHIDLLKIDVEGAEYMVFKGAMETIRGGIIQHIQFEFGAGNITSRVFFHDFWELLSPYYHFNLVLQGGLVPITSYNTEWEIFRTVNYWLTKK